MPDAQTSPDPPVQLEGGTYEILRNRLRSHGEELKARLRTLNENRKHVFGSIEQKLLNTERVTTEHNCVPRDMVAVGSRFLFGYNVHFGLREERNIGDVFTVYEFDSEGHALEARTLDLIEDARFRKDFQDVYRYYKNATFAKFLDRSPHLYMVFQVGKSPQDIKSFKWLIEENSLRYLDNRSDHEVRFPPQHEFEWIRTTRDQHRQGTHPHISIEDRLFVETVGGDLTIKIENNTDSGEGIYAEPVDDPDQTLDDAEIHYAVVGNLILLKIRPYQETGWRHIIYNEKLQQAIRMDSIADACVLLPDDHGLMFANGYYLQSGERKTFETSLQGLKFERRIASPNGEDTLFVFYQPESGDYVLLGYNVISQTVETPVVCHGFTLFRGGQMVQFKSNHQPQKHHAIQIWQTPYVGEDFQPQRETDSYLYKIGNRDIVRAMAECHEILTLIDKEDSYAGLYLDLAKLAQDVLDSYFWLNHEEAADLADPLQQIREAASAAVDEFEKVVRVRRNTEKTTKQVAGSVREILNQVGRRQFNHIDAFVQSLAALRAIRGEIIGLKELRYVNLELVEGLEKEVSESTERLSNRCVDFLLRDEALKPYADAIAAEHAGVDQLQKVADAKEVDERVAQSARELEMLIEIVSNLKIDDATKRTSIIDNISALFSQVNTTRAALKRKIQELASVEGAAEFSSQMKLLSQSVVNFLDVCDTPEKCDDSLTRLMIQIEELEGKFAEFDDFVVELAEKREEVAAAFESRRMQLIERRNKRAQALAQAADRILKGIRNRVETFQTVSEIHGYFAADLMIDKVRSIITELEELEDSVKADDLQSRLKTIREDAVRQLKDRQELFEDGQHVLRFGKHRFTVNTQPLDLTTVIRDGKMTLHLSGTNFYEPIDNAELNETRDVWAMEVPSENDDVARAEYLAYRMLMAIRSGEIAPPTSTEDELLAKVHAFMAPRYREGYVKGVHDLDAARILAALLEIDARCGLLRYSSDARGFASLYWWHFGDSRRKKRIESQLAGFGTIAKLFPDAAAHDGYLDDLQTQLRRFVGEQGELAIWGKYVGESTVEQQIDEAAKYLFAELTSHERELRGNQFVSAQRAIDLVRAFHEHLRHLGAEQTFADSLKALQKDVLAGLQLARDWLRAFLATPQANSLKEAGAADFLDEAAFLLLSPHLDERTIVTADLHRTLDGMSSSHPRMTEGKYELNFNRFLSRLSHFDRTIVPRYNNYHELKSRFVDTARDSLRLSEYEPKVLSSFVRNKLIDQVYLPLIGSNLAKQIGTAGETTRTDRQGLLLLISPPGYGKTTLMEYIANRLGIVFMKVNGPAIGHAVTSLDPQAAPNAGAREEIEKLNLAFEMGDNVMIYLDDIQHCHPEFLQKFISLCDAQRKIEGVWKGESRTYDFRGKKVAVVMAGNPYTESGEKFRIPDMLANRADIYNLGEIIGDSKAAFEMSYLENSLTSNPVLSRLAMRSQKDVYGVIKLAERARESDGKPPSTEGIEFEGNESAEELNEFVSVMTKLLRVRDVVLRVNREYIHSAAQHDDYRTEPAFLLQGSYRNMNRIAEKVMPVMNDQELETLILSSYQNDAQTLTTGTESNLLKFKELLGIQADEERQRWEDIKRTYRQNVKLRGIGSDDKMGQVIGTLLSFSDGLHAIQNAVQSGVTAISTNGDADSEAERIRLLSDGLRELSDRMATSLSRIEELAQRPIQVDVPPIEMNWPDSLPKLLSSPVESAPTPPSLVPTSPPELSNEGDENAAPEHRITVVNRLPRSVYRVIESQFQLMENWLKPLTELATRQHQDLRDLRPMIEDCLESYQDLLEKLHTAKRESNEE